MRIRIKICGMTDRKDVELARTAGADLVGFIFAPSPRQVTVAQARALVHDIDGIQGVAVVRGISVDEIRRIREETGLRWVQFHEPAPPETVLPFAPFVLRVFDRFGEAERASLPAFAGAAFLLDRPKEGGGGGPGPDPAFVAEAKKHGPVLLAGGLGPDNVAESIRRFRPDGIDACSRLEASPGKKDPGRLRAFITAVRAAERELGPA